MTEDLFDVLLDSLPGIFLSVEAVSLDTMTVYHDGVELSLLVDGLEVTVSGQSPYEPLPHKFRFRSEAMVLPVLVPFLMQCFDGLRRL